MRVLPYSEKWKSQWNEYVSNSKNASFFHLIEWKEILKKTFGYKPYYLLAEDEGKIVGILPLFLLKNIFFDNIMISLPFAIYGGADADNENIETLLIEEAKSLTRKTKAQYLELRNLKENRMGFLVKDLYVTFIKPLPTDVSKCLEEMPRKARAATRKGLGFGLTAEVGLHFLKDFYQIYSISVRNLGSPVFSFSFLENIVAQFKNESNVLIVKYGNKPVAGVFTFFYRDTVMPYYGGSLAEYQRYQINNFMYLKLMEYGVEKKYKYFDFGRSKKGTGSFKFKELMGFEPQQLYYSYHLHKVNELPNLSPTNPKLNLFIKTWQRLPLTITNLIGPQLIKFTPP